MAFLWGVSSLTNRMISRCLVEPARRKIFGETGINVVPRRSILMRHGVTQDRLHDHADPLRKAHGRSKDMAALDPGRTTDGGDYDLSNPINSFIDVVRQLVFQPVSFFARLPRRG